MQNIIAICGIKNSGKTTLIEQIVPALTIKGLKVAYIKHDGHDFTCDVPATDSYRMSEAGAYGVAVFSKNRFFIHKEIENTECEMMMEMFPEADVILVEGMKDSSYPKIEIVRKGISEASVSNPEGRFLIVTDCDEPLGEKTMGFGQIQEIADLIAARVK